LQDSPLMQRVFSVIGALQNVLCKGMELDIRTFPRNMESLIVYSLEIPVVRIQDLTLAAASRYLCALRGKTEAFNEINNRNLYGLLHIGPPCNIIFVREDLPAHIRNYVLAHELGHFLIDVFSVRHLWLKTFPEQRDAIERAFKWQEANALLDLQVLIKGLPPRPRAITSRGEEMAPGTSEREIQADLFAREFMAPLQLVSDLFRANAGADFIKLLREQFGLPQRIAKGYYLELRLWLEPKADFIERLFAPLLISENKNSQ